MPTFAYQAKQGPSEVVEGTIEAQTKDEVVAQLLRDGLVPISVLIQPGDLPIDGARARRVRVRATEVRLFTRQLSTLLRAKVELVPAMRMLEEQSPSPGLGRLLEDLEHQMRDGNSFSDALARHPRVFSPFFRAAIRAGEAAGTLDDVLLRLVALGEQQEQMESRLRGALAYPCVLLALGLACVGFFIWFVVPRMAGMFAQFGGELPWPTRVLLEVSTWLQTSWGWVLGGVALLGVVVTRLARLPVVAQAAEEGLRLVPMTRDILEARQIAGFSRTLQLLVRSGLPIYQAIDIARPTLGSARTETRVREAQEAVKRGGGVAESFKTARCFPPIVVHLIAVGEAGGTLEQVLDELGAYYERFLDESLRITASLVEPLMIILMGVLVGFCVLAMVLPIFEMTRLVG